MGVFSGFWKDTGTKVARRQKQRAQGWFIKHPITFGVTWGVTAGAKGLFWTLPRFGYRKWTGRPAKPKPAASGSTGLVTVTETVDSEGNISTTTRTTTVSGRGPFAMAPTAAVGGTTSNNGRPALVLVDPAERNQLMASSKAQLAHTRLGAAFLGLATEFDNFVPVRGAEAVSTVQMIHDAYLGFKRVSMGVDAFADLVGDCGLNRKIVNHLHDASAAADALDQAMKRANTQVAAFYDGQIEQDQSGSSSVQTSPVQIGVGDDAEGIGPFSAVIANQYEAFDPPADTEATLIFEHIKTSGLGFAVLSDSLVKLAQRMRRHGIDARIRRLIRAAGGDAVATSSHFQAARKDMWRLYQGQMAQEASGITMIRTAPLSRAS